ncbi:MAG TPA: histidine kinase dimerization/phosphoacceptor domain -containing protein [Beijerinckiaceae bacterium]|jgi:chemotaxis protein methyltransferase CheR
MIDVTQAHTENRSSLAQAIVNTVREPLLVLDSDLRVVVASRSYCQTFQTTPDKTQGYLLYELGAGEWNIAALRLRLGRIVPEHGVMDGFEVEQTFPRIGQRTMLLNARKVFCEGDTPTTLLLAIEDITERRASERALASLSEQKDVLLREMSHRVANSLQIIASILLMKARTVQSEETRLHLQDAHQRVMSVAALQQHLQASGKGEEIEVGPYLSKLCETLAASMIGESRPMSLRVVAGRGTASSSRAVSLGLIVTELVINALKHAFAADVPDGHVVVGYEADRSDWKLSVSDNGRGMPGTIREPKSGLGTTLIKALAQQLEARVELMTGPRGTTVSVTRATFSSHLRTAA